MKFLLKPTDPAKLDVDVLIIFCWEKDLPAGRQSKPLPSELSDLDSKLSGLIREAAEKEEFSGRQDQFVTLSTKGYIGAYKLLLVGMGEKENFDLYALRKVVASAVKKAKEAKPARLGLIVDDFWLKKFNTQEIVQAVVESVYLSSYRFLRYKSDEEKREREIEEVVLSLPANKLSSAEEGVKTGEIGASATCFARDLVNEPSVVTTPSYLAEVASSIAKESKGAVKARIYEKEEIEKLGMRSFLGVAKGAEEPPKFIHLAYKPSRFKTKVVLIGKGITFDTGGLSLKSGEAMETMKSDMAGAAAILAIFKALTALRLPVCVVGLIAACENMPSGQALKPGDVLYAMNGKTIEVLNTDAEGRLTLADALSFAAVKEKPDEIIDIATLTGACRVALGEEIAGLWGNDSNLVEKIKKSATASGEKVWPMPLEMEYKELIKSEIADLKNTQTGKAAAAIAGALFLSEFVGKIPWAHLDIAGPAFYEKETPLVPKGGSGFGVRLLLHFLKEL